MNPPKTVIIIPTYNEKDNVRTLTSKIMALGIPNLEIHFIDDKSPDGTAAEIEKITALDPNVRLTVRSGRLGLGSAELLGFKEALKQDADIVITMDSDFQHPPSLLPRMIEAIDQGNDVVIASRKIEGGGSEGFGFGRGTVSRTADWLARTWLGLPVKDGTSGYKAFSKRAAEALIDAEELLPYGYSFQVVTLYHLKKSGMKMFEVPFIFKPRKSGKSKLGIRGILGFIWDVLTARDWEVSSLD